MTTYILGLNGPYHDLSACLLRDGELCLAIEEERLTRVKHGKTATIDNADQLPVAAIRACLDAAGIELADVDHIGYSFVPELRLRGLGDDPHTVADDWGTPGGEARLFARLAGVPAQLSALARCDLGDRFRWLPHHVCHAASAFFPSDFAESAVLTIDGIGEHSSTWMGHGVDRRLTPIGELEYPHSIGFLWEKLCQFIGFSEYDAGKVMGLSAYGDPRRYAARMERLVDRGSPGDPRFAADLLRFRAPDFSALEELFSTPRRDRGEPLTQVHRDIAAALQQLTSQLVLGLAEHVAAATGSRRLCLAGGVALNCLANYELMKSGRFAEIYVQPAANDAGTALGAALYIHHVLLRQPRGFVMDHPYWGPEYDDAAIEAALRAADVPSRRVDAMAPRVAGLLRDGNIVGWFQGRVEWGPRALGNRSLLADPRRADMQDTLNRRVKQRESFRPFAPSVLAEEADAWFDIPRGCSSRATEFMEFTFPLRPGRGAQIPAVTHVDDTSRIQVVRRERNPRYHALISAFHELTGVPMVLNTSFNENEPIVCTPADALRTYQRAGMDYLVLGDHLVGPTP